MDEDPASVRTGAADDTVDRSEASRHRVVSVPAAVWRSAVGLVVAAVVIWVLSWIIAYSDNLLALMGALIWLYRPDDRRSRWACIAALLTAFPATVGAAVILNGSVPQPWDGFLFAAIGAIVASIAYAWVTQFRSIAEQASR